MTHAMEELSAVIQSWADAGVPVVEIEARVALGALRSQLMRVVETRRRPASDNVVRLRARLRRVRQEDSSA